jgi:hypothetical protein
MVAKRPTRPTVFVDERPGCRAVRSRPIRTSAKSMAQDGDADSRLNPGLSRLGTIHHRQQAAMGSVTRRGYDGQSRPEALEELG